MNVALDHVTINPAGYALAGFCLWGRVYCSIYEFTEIFGAPAEHDPGGEHWQNAWYFETPRGRACVRDWHQSSGGRLSIVAGNWRAALWLASYLRAHRLRASGRYL